ncbi:hypothetical protein [Streptococcus suis]|uniref:hypothetical protein n=1 Tax=Streptococcus suis TaxID=1307 RepID=UPI002AB4348D|nr:hypothetical protein [Streptococcus suis]MDY7603054.1 hypothetical protein [Streptococcus suis]
MINNVVLVGRLTRDVELREVIKKTFNYYLGTLFSDEDMALIYQRLGNGINPELTYRFIDSGFDMKVLDDET